jgi:hypothetical protein
MVKKRVGKKCGSGCVIVISLPIKSDIFSESSSEKAVMLVIKPVIQMFQSGLPIFMTSHPESFRD